MNKIEILWEFLQKWKENTKDFLIKNGQLLRAKKEKANKVYDDWKVSNPMPSFSASKEDYWKWTNKRQQMFNEYYKDINPLTFKLYSNTKGGLDVDRLEKLLDREVEHKYVKFVSRISNIVGNILDVSNLYIAEDGEINGFAIGDKGKAKIETITAGGYNVQIFHFRTLIKPLK